MTDESKQINKPKDWPGRISGLMLGAALGIATNRPSGRVAYFLIAALIVLAALLTASARIRRLPPRAPIVRYVLRLMLIISLLGAILAAAGTPSWRPYASFGAVAVAGAALIIPAGTLVRLIMLFGMSCVGIGVACLGKVVAVLADQTAKGSLIGDVAISVLYISMGAMLMYKRERIAVALHVREFNPTHATIGARASVLGISGIGGGIGLLAAREFLIGAALIGLGIAAMWTSVAIISASPGWKRVTKWLSTLTKEPSSE